MSAIALFGPSASGKTTVLRAFCRAMADGQFNQLLIDNSMDVGIIVNGQEIDLYETSSPVVLPTQIMEIDDLVFRRFPKSESPSYAQQVSTFQHRILIHDNKGMLFARGADKGIVSLQNLKALSPEIDQAWTNLENSPGLIILLDHALLKDSAYEGHFDASSASSSPQKLDVGKEDLDFDSLLGDSQDNVSLGQSGNIPSRSTEMSRFQTESFSENQVIFTQAQYARMVGRIGEWLSAKTPSGYARKIAICFTKADLLGDAIKLDTMQLVNQYFGQSMGRAIKSLEVQFGSESVYVFVISALGYDVRDGQSNYDLGQRWLKNPKHWKPENVHKPFLWIFEQLEKDQIKRAAKDLKSFKKSFYDMRLDAYIPYITPKKRPRY